MLGQGLQAWYAEVRNREAAFFGLERRSPFFDQRLIEFCLGLPPEQKIGAGWTRLILRRALGGILPPAIQWRVDKSDLSPNFRRSFLHYEGERLSRMAAAPGPIEPYVDMARVRAALDSYQAKHLNTDALLLWKCLTLYEWLLFAFGAVVPADRMGVK
jgi:asparagine synthase (glutamine-hydrolysing)